MAQQHYWITSKGTSPILCLWNHTQNLGQSLTSIQNPEMPTLEAPNAYLGQPTVLQMGKLVSQIWPTRPKRQLLWAFYL